MRERERTGDERRDIGNGQLEMRKGADIAARLMGYAVAVLRLCAEIPKDPAGRHVALQLIRSATAAGANYEEARAAESHADLVHKVSVAAKEIREASYWVGLIRRAHLAKNLPQELIQESIELAAILGASSRTARARAESQRLIK